MQFINTPDHKDGTQALAHRIVDLLFQGRKVLWLIAGGSNIPIAAAAMAIIRADLAQRADKKFDTKTLSIYLDALTVTLTDERYGPVGHPDSNWKQLQDSGMDMSGIKAFPILDGHTLAQTVSRFGSIIENILSDTDVIVGQFGMGADGHIAGILPHSTAVSEVRLPVCGYESKPFTRVTLTFPIIRKVNVAYMFVSNSTKKDAIDLLGHSGVTLDDEPAQILKDIGEVFIYIDP